MKSEQATKRKSKMNIVLLSGGSGKRLWPLSNDVRSKQFIKFLKNDSGEYESMVQRVFGQIKRNIKTNSVTIATSKSQVSAIRRQLGDLVDICIEPCRRDTFPAIVLACAYLKDVLKVADDECVAICPVDPYVDDSYYQAVQGLEKIVKGSDANLVLLGIDPTYPSEKYGYIIPTDSKNVSDVLEFKEKPSRQVAEEYLKRNALWNAGVFAFKLGYLLEKAHSMIDFNGYEDLYRKYETLTKISFDYAVVEKENKIKVAKYVGQWKDIGTWNTMTDVMANKTLGNAILHESCNNTHIVNELDIPIVGVGLNNIVVAASPDGILVSDKFQSEKIKNIVQDVNQGIRFAEKSWGTFEVINRDENSLTALVTLTAGKSMSYHYHQSRDEVWTVLSGTGKIIIDGVEQDISRGNTVTIKAGCKHTIKAITELTLIEVQIGAEIGVADKFKVGA